MNCSPPSSFIHGISQVRILEGVAVSFSRGSSQYRNCTHISCLAGSFFITKPSGEPKDSCQCRRHRRLEFNPWVRKTPWRRKWQPTRVFLPGKSHVQKSLEGYSSWGCKRVTHNLTAEHACMINYWHLYLLIGVGNGNPLQYFCLENFKDGGAW